MNAPILTENIIKNERFDAERALYALKNTAVEGCAFEGEADGESALKECRDITVKSCSFSLRYPLWHVRDFTLHDSQMDELTRAAIWYAENGKITETGTHDELLKISEGYRELYETQFRRVIDYENSKNSI